MRSSVVKVYSVVYGVTTAPHQCQYSLDDPVVWKRLTGGATRGGACWLLSEDDDEGAMKKVRASHTLRTYLNIHFSQLHTIHTQPRFEHYTRYRATPNSTW